MYISKRSGMDHTVLPANTPACHGTSGSRIPDLRVVSPTLKPLHYQVTHFRPHFVQSGTESGGPSRWSSGAPIPPRSPPTYTYLRGGETEDGEAGVLRSSESSLLGADDQRHDDEPGQKVGQRQRRHQQVGDRVAQALVTQGDENQGAVAEYDEDGEYRQRHVLQRQLLVRHHLAV